MLTRIGGIGMRLEVYPQVDWLSSVSVDVQMKSIEEAMQWKYWSRC